jgi:hypothetical protein
MILGMIFVPKIKFQRDLLRSIGSDNQANISGLASGALSMPEIDSSSQVFGVSEVMSDKDNQRRSAGEKILTSKSPQELVREIDLLKCMLLSNRKTVEKQAHEITELKTLLKENGLVLSKDHSSVDSASKHETGTASEDNENISQDQERRRHRKH